MVNAAILPLFRIENVRLPHNARAVFKNSFQLHVRVCHRQHAAGNRKHLPHHGDSLFKAPGHTVERRKQEIAERLSSELPLRKAVIKQTLHHRFGIGKCLHTLADISRRQNAHFTAQHAAAAAIICHRDDRCQPVGIFF